MNCVPGVITFESIEASAAAPPFAPRLRRLLRRLEAARRLVHLRALASRRPRGRAAGAAARAAAAVDVLEDRLEHLALALRLRAASGWKQVDHAVHVDDHRLSPPAPPCASRRRAARVEELLDDERVPPATSGRTTDLVRLRRESRARRRGATRASKLSSFSELLKLLLDQNLWLPALRNLLAPLSPSSRATVRARPGRPAGPPRPDES